jgi:signal peptidase I
MSAAVAERRGVSAADRGLAVAPPVDEDDESAENAPHRSSLRAAILEWGGLGLGILLLTAFLHLAIAQAFYIPSGSMLPQLQINDRIIVSKLSYRLHEPRRGDIVVFDAPKSMVRPKDPDPLAVRIPRTILEGINVVKPAQTEFVKRVIGLPGDRLEARNGNVYVNGSLLVEPYLPPGVRTLNLEQTTVPKGMLFVMGDNRTGSSDSRVFGPIPESSVVGRAVVRFWPLGNASWL